MLHARARRVGVALIAASMALVAVVAWAKQFNHDEGSWTGISGENASGLKEQLYSGGVALRGITGCEKADDPVLFKVFGSMLDDQPNTSHYSGELKIYDAYACEKADLPTDQYATALQTCVTNSKIKGVRLWGARVNEDGTLQAIADPVEFKRTNCSGHWKNKVSCPAGKVATGVRGYYSASKGFSGIALRCSAIEER